MGLIDTIPGMARRRAELLLAEVGTDRQRCPTAAHLCQWAEEYVQAIMKARLGSILAHHRVTVGSRDVSADGKCRRRCKSSYLATVFRRLAARRGHKRAILAVAHRLLIAVSHMLPQHQPYRDYQLTPWGQCSQEQRLQQLQRRRVAQLGYQVQLIPLSTADAPH